MDGWIEPRAKAMMEVGLTRLLRREGKGRERRNFI